MFVVFSNIKSFSIILYFIPFLSFSNFLLLTATSIFVSGFSVSGFLGFDVFGFVSGGFFGVSGFNVCFSVVFRSVSGGFFGVVFGFVSGIFFFFFGVSRLNV